MSRFRILACLLGFLGLLPSQAFSQDPSFSVYMDNPGYSSSTVFEFDVMVKAVGATTSFQLRTFQAGIYVDSAWIASGAISVSTVASSSQLASAGYNGSFSWNSTDRLINCSVNTGVRITSASCVSTSIGTAPLRVARLRLTNSVPFSCVSPNLKFNYVQNASPLRLRTSLSWRASGCAVNYDMYYPNRPFTGVAYFNGELYSASDADGRSPASTIVNAIPPCTVPYNLTVFIEGYYLGSGTMQPVLLNAGVAGATVDQTDTISVELRNTADPSILVSSLNGVLSTSGQATFYFPLATASQSYWLVVKHRSSIETWTAAPVTLSANGSYDFSQAAASSYGSNIASLGGGYFGLFSGDMNRDGFVDAFDFDLYNQDNLNFMFGYYNTDLNGDGFVDTFDFDLFNNNNLNFVMAITP